VTTEPQTSASPAPVPHSQTSGKATAALVLGICGIIVFPLVCSVLAIIFGQQAKNDIARNPSIGGYGMAQAGFILGIIGTAFGALLFLIFLAALGSA
jgi:hypothetical protein